MAITHRLGFSDDLKLNRAAEAAASKTHGVLLFIRAGAGNAEVVQQKPVIGGLARATCPWHYRQSRRYYSTLGCKIAGRKTKVSPP